MTRYEHGRTCPLGFTGQKRRHIWLEITLLHHGERRFSCDLCAAVATEILVDD